MHVVPDRRGISDRNVHADRFRTRAAGRDAGANSTVTDRAPEYARSACTASVYGPRGSGIRRTSGTGTTGASETGNRISASSRLRLPSISNPSVTTRRTGTSCRPPDVAHHQCHVLVVVDDDGDQTPSPGSDRQRDVRDELGAGRRPGRFGDRTSVGVQDHSSPVPAEERLVHDVHDSRSSFALTRCAVSIFGRRGGRELSHIRTRVRTVRAPAADSTTGGGLLAGETEQGQFPVQRRPGDSQGARGVHPVATGFPQDLGDEVPFGGLDRVELPARTVPAPLG